MLFVLWSFWPDLNRRPIDYEASKKSIIHIILYNFNFTTTIYCGKSVANNFLTSLRHSFQSNNPPFRGDCPGGSRAAADYPSPFSGISPSSIASCSGLSVPVFGDYGAAALYTSTRGALSSLPGGALSARSALQPSITFAGRAVDAALKVIRLSACAGLPAPHNHKPPADRRSTKMHGARESASGGFRFPRCARTRHQSPVRARRVFLFIVQINNK